MNCDIQLVHRSSTRRKACAGCIKAKRRCDQSLPSCSRCTKRGSHCQYDDGSLAIGLPSEKTSPAISANLDENLVNAFDFDYSNISLADFSTPYDSFYFPELREFSPQQIASCASLLQGFISSFVLKNGTPFMHPSLYSDMPNAFEDCLAICGLYMNKTAANRSIIFRMLDGKIDSLVKSSRLIVYPRESLLEVQALLMYQIIRLFDGDDKQRLNAERDFSLLESWTLRLQQTYFEAQPSLEDWVMRESIRRTIMMSVVLQGLLEIMKSGACDLVPFMSTLPVSHGGWEECELVPYTTFIDEWNEGRVGKVGEYEKLLLIACPHARNITAL